MYLYCFLLPFQVDSLGWLTSFITVFIACTFVAFEATSDELETRRTEPNDLALNVISGMIETTLLEMIEKPTPGAIKPDSYMIA